MFHALRVAFLRAAMRLPDRAVRRLGWGPREVDGVPLSARLRWFLRVFSLDPGGVRRATPEGEREAFRHLACSEISGPVLEVRTEDRVVDGPHPVPIRVYKGDEDATPQPLLLWIHGGGWVIGDLDTHDRFCRRLCRDTGAIIVAIDYRLAPEHPFPAAVEDVTAVWRWIAREARALGADPHRLAMGGDSAGGNMTAVLCQQLPPAQRPCLQVLCYAGVDFSQKRPSRRSFGDGFLLTDALIDWFLDHYAGSRDRTDPRLSPLLGQITEQPPALLITAGLDPLLDEGLEYGDRLEANGTVVERQHVPEMIHGFVTLYGALPNAEKAVAEMTRRIRASLVDRA